MMELAANARVCQQKRGGKLCGRKCPLMIDENDALDIQKSFAFAV
jgi:hypothetical protein